MNDQNLTTPPNSGDTKVPIRVNQDIESFSAGYKLSAEQARFFKSETGTDDDDELKTHILGVQEEAYKIFPYVCIKGLTFLRLGISSLPEYEQIIKLGKERPDGILLDIGCCFGVDARKAISDGFPLENTVTTDLNKEFYSMGHALFKTTPDNYPLSFVPGDAFDPDMLKIVPPFDEPPSTEKPDLSTLTSLNPLAGRCSVIYASNFFHLFSEEKQLHLAKALAGLLSSEPGSMICGEHAAYKEKRILRGEHAGMTFDMFQHSPESWTAIWEEQVFDKGRVKVNARIEEFEVATGFSYDRLQWSVVRL